LNSARSLSWPAGHEEAPGPHLFFGQAVGERQALQLPFPRELGGALARLAADSDHVDAAGVKFVEAALELAKLSPADRAMQAAEEDDHREQIWRLLVEPVGPSAQQWHRQVGSGLPRAHAVSGRELGGG
jgi:hypothetical protein